MSRLARSKSLLLPHIQDSIDTGWVMCFELQNTRTNAPQFNFICRENVILSIDSDKTDEAELQNAVTNAVLQSDAI
ncbi:hypothetical protein RND71_015230 [Anisodus tanguticus]|uniref:Uncharacterized protein n=1 Tax=Anisodus tanguticus TaxID=243964 RepID=A0AAE1S6R6_9SOLA|nr:hypothetical protein RND71_015230 [Anisodus tanguticus]